MKPLENKLVAMFADGSLDLRMVIEDLMHTNIDNHRYDYQYQCA